jgi:hypothetical protein
MFDIDVHVLRLPTENESWFEECYELLKKEPINIHILPGIPGNILQARINGYRKGTSKYVSFVDPDDKIEPGIFEKILSEIKETSVGLYTQSSIIDMHGKTIVEQMAKYMPWEFEKMFSSFFQIHQLVVMRRDKIEIVNNNISRFYKLPHPYIEHLRYVLLSCLGDWQASPEIGYHWRRNGNKGRLLNGYSISAIEQYLEILPTIMVKRAQVLEV